MKITSTRLSLCVIKTFVLSWRWNYHEMILLGIEDKDRHHSSWLFLYDAKLHKREGLYLSVELGLSTIRKIKTLLKRSRSSNRNKFEMLINISFVENYRYISLCTMCAEMCSQTIWYSRGQTKIFKTIWKLRYIYRVMMLCISHYKLEKVFKAFIDSNAQS